jgi:aspartyl/asparaginyl beta-hydroxylase (cupin superfamily)
MLKEDQQKFLDTLIGSTDILLQEYLENAHKRTIPMPGFDEHSTPQQDWRGIALWWRQEPWPIYQRWFPKSTELVRNGPAHNSTGPLILKPHSATPKHNHTEYDYWHNKIIAHIPLIIPEGDVGFWVGGKVHRWKVGEMFAFDITKEHYGFNNTDEDRVIFILDFDATVWGEVLKPYMLLED